MERSPASRLGIVAIDSEANRRDWHFGELVALLGRALGAFAARGVHKGDVVGDAWSATGSKWVLTLLACWRMGAVALPCSTMLRRADLEHRVAAANPKLCVGDDDLLAELPPGVPTMTPRRDCPGARRGPAAGDSGAVARDGRRRTRR